MCCLESNKQQVRAGASVTSHEIVGYANALKVELELLREEVAVSAACAGEENKM